MNIDNPKNENRMSVQGNASAVHNGAESSAIFLARVDETEEKRCKIRVRAVKLLDKAISVLAELDPVNTVNYLMRVCKQLKRFFPDHFTDIYTNCNHVQHPSKDHLMRTNGRNDGKNISFTLFNNLFGKYLSDSVLCFVAESAITDFTNSVPLSVIIFARHLK